MRNSPRVTVILTSYNHSPYIGAAIESVLNQTYSNYSLVVADDGSTDESWSIATSYSDPRIKLFRNEHNEGGMLNKVIHSHLVDGSLVAIHHSDDLWESTKLEKQVAYLEQHDDVAACFTNAEIIDAQGRAICNNPNNNPTIAFYLKIFTQENRTREQWLRRFAYQGNCLCHPSVLIRKSCYEKLGGYDSRFTQFPDFQFWIRLCMEHNIFVMSEKLTRLRLHGDSSNSSALTEQNIIRKSFEHMHVLEPLRSIHSVDELLAIFPEAQDYAETSSPVLGYCLARSLLHSERLPVRSFALQILFELLESQETATALAGRHNFTFKDYSSLLTRVDMFGVKSARSNKELRGRVADLRKECSDANDSLFLANCRTRLLEKSVAAHNKSFLARVSNAARRLWIGIYSLLSGREHLDKHIRLIAESGLFDQSYYLLRYRDVAKAGICPIKHYLIYGAKEGRNPSHSFNTLHYIKANPESRGSAPAVNPLVHYIRTKQITDTF